MERGRLLQPLPHPQVGSGNWLPLHDFFSVYLCFFSLVIRFYMARHLAGVLTGAASTRFRSFFCILRGQDGCGCCWCWSFNELEGGAHGGAADGVSFWVWPVVLCLILYWHMAALKQRWVVRCTVASCTMAEYAEFIHGFRNTESTRRGQRS